MTTKFLRKHLRIFLAFILTIFCFPVQAHLNYSPHGVIEALDKNKRELMEKYGPSVFPIYAKIKALIITKFGQKEENVVKYIGTAWVIRSDGYLLTVYHVVDSDEVRKEYETSIREKYKVLPISEEVTINFSAEYYVEKPKDRKFPVEIVAKDTEKGHDLALLRLDKKWGLTFPALPLGDFTKHSYGSVVSIGTPVGIPGVPTDGTLASTSLRACEKGDKAGNYLLFMSAINVGNSGGPTILRETGEVLSMADAIILESYGHTFVSCGIPSSTIQKFLDKNLPPRK